MANDVEGRLRPWTSFLQELGGREQRKALRGAMRREGQRVRKLAISALHGSGLKVGPAADKNIRLWVYGRGLGFLVTVKAGGRGKRNDAVMYTTSRGLKKPILMRSNEGTEERRTKNRTKFFIRTRRGHSTGMMPATHFMAKAEAQAPGVIEPNIAKDIEQSVTRVARKNGLL